MFLYGGMTSADDPETTETKAIAIKGTGDNGDSPSAPRITAKGSGEFAEKLLDIAFAEGVKVRQDRDLTELLDAFEVDSPVPLEALHAVSLILERVYAENQRMAGAGDDGDTVTAAKAPPSGPTILDGATGEPVAVSGDDTPTGGEDGRDG